MSVILSIPQTGIHVYKRFYFSHKIDSDDDFATHFRYNFIIVIQIIFVIVNDISPTPYIGYFESSTNDLARQPLYICSLGNSVCYRTV